MTDVTMPARPPGGEPKRGSGIELFRVRQIPDGVESRPFSTAVADMPSINPPASKAYYFLLMAPAILVLAFISIYPFIWMIYMSLHDVDIGKVEWNNFENFTRLVGDARFLSGWWLLIQYSLLCLVLQIAIGLFLAVSLNGSRFEKVLVTTLLMPMMMAPLVAGMVWYFLYNGTFGWYHWLLQSVGILGPKSILASSSTAMIGIVLVDVWQWTPLITLITLAGLKRVPQDQLEANMVDGASPLRNFMSVTLPNLYPVLLIAIMLRFMDNFRFIDSILVLTGGGPGNSTKILPVYLFEVSFKFFKLGRGAAIALILLVVTIILGMLLVRIFDRQQTKKV
jgi:multiple sugar transport system permease protein